MRENDKPFLLLCVIEVITGDAKIAIQYTSVNFIYIVFALF